jgi:hypothetical protein
MKRITIKNLNDQLIANADLEDPTEWIASGVEQNWWGLPDRWIIKEFATPEEIDSSVDQREVPVDELNPSAGLRAEIKLPATYTIEVQDVSQEYQLKDAEAHILAISQSCDEQVLALLNGREKTTMLAFALNDLVQAMNIFGDQTEDQIGNAKARLQGFSMLFGQILALMDQRDADIAAYRSSLGIV